MVLLRGFEDGGLPQEGFEIFLKLLAPFAPHITEEIWRETPDPGARSSIHCSAWPLCDASLIKEDVITLVLQINGKIRDTISVDSLIDEAKARELALKSGKIRAALGDRKPKRIIYVPKRIVNIVT
jgi:leucyl-tRNA synthetase